MPRSARLVAATVGLLLLVACADRPPAQAHHPAKPARGAGAERPTSHDRGGESNELVTLEAPPALARQTPPSVSGEPLPQRYASARPLAVQRGSASYYSDSFAGRSTASGAAYEPRGFTAAHRSLPFGTVLRVSRTDDGQSVYVRVTDRGPYGPKGRILDLSRAAAERLGMLRAGVVKIKLEVVEYGPRKPRRRRR